jgi:hypothetical protein
MHLEPPTRGDSYFGQALQSLAEVPAKILTREQGHPISHAKTETSGPEFLRAATISSTKVPHAAVGSSGASGKVGN